MKQLKQEWISQNSAPGTNIGAHKMILPSVSKGEIILTYKPQGFWYQQMEDGTCNLQIPGAGHITQPGSPMLPQEGLFIAIPPGMEIASLEITKTDEETYPTPVQINPVPVPSKGTDPLISQPDPYLYHSDNFYPGIPAVHLGEIKFMGIFCTHLYICPMKYNPVKRELILIHSLTIRITYQASSTTTVVDNTADAEDSANGVESAVFCGNPAMKDFILGCPPQKEHNGLPRLLLVAGDTLAGYFDSFKNARSGQYRVEEISVDTIKSQYSGMDTPEAIRTYLMNQHRQEPLHTVILCGNAARVPSYSGYGCQSDSYYAATSQENLSPLFSVARFPAATGTQMRDMAKYAAGYNNQKSSVRNNAIFVAYDDESFINCSNTIVSSLDSRFHAIKRYDNEYGHIDVIRSINAGSGFINYRGHGDVSSWSSANAPKRSEIPRLKTGSHAPHVFSIACLTNSIETDTCYGITWVKERKAISFLGASRTSWRTQNNAFDQYLWEYINAKQYSTIGEIYQAATIQLYKNDKSSYSAENIEGYLLLGDGTAEYGA